MLYAVPQTEHEQSNSTCFMQYHKLSRNEATVHVLCSTRAVAASLVSPVSTGLHVYAVHVCVVFVCVVFVRFVFVPQFGVSSVRVVASLKPILQPSRLWDQGRLHQGEGQLCGCMSECVQG